MADGENAKTISLGRANHSASTPLLQHMAKLMKQPEYARLAKFGNLLEHFHLKHTITDKVSGRRISISGRELINFGSANYLGLEQHPSVIEASIRGLKEFGTHAGCSRIFSSHQNIVQLEEELSALVGAEKTLVGHNISQIHAGVIPALWSSENSILYIDRFAHTSIFQACQIAKAKGAQIVRVDVSDLLALEKIFLSAKSGSAKVLFVDGVYSMQGHTPPLRELVELCHLHQGVLYVDDAHGIGVIGTHGGGVAEELSLSFDNMLLVGSLQKAFGTYGGFISGDEKVIEYLRSTSKAYIFSGTLQPSAVEGAREAIRICRSDEGSLLRIQLNSMSRQLRAGLQAQGFSVPGGDSPIIPVLIGEDMKTMMAGRKLFDLGIFLNSVVFPAVPVGGGILRISLTAAHSMKDVEALLSAFAELKIYLQKYDSKLLGTLHLAKEILKSKIQGSSYEGL